MCSVALSCAIPFFKLIDGCDEKHLEMKLSPSDSRKMAGKQFQTVAYTIHLLGSIWVCSYVVHVSPRASLVHDAILIQLFGNL